MQAPSTGVVGSQLTGATNQYLTDMTTEKKQSERRDTLIFGTPKNWDNDRNGIWKFDGISNETLTILLSEELIDPNESQNNSPTVGEIKEFLDNHEGFLAHGYVVSPYRNDSRVSLEGVTKSGEIDKDDVIAFYEMFRFADEITAHEKCLHCWYD